MENTVVYLQRVPVVYGATGGVNGALWFSLCYLTYIKLIYTSFLGSHIMAAYTVNRTNRTGTEWKILLYICNGFLLFMVLQGG